MSYNKHLGPAPPEELQALCALMDVSWKPVTGRPGNMWKVYVICADGQEYARNISVTDLDTWTGIVQWLYVKRLGHTPYDS